MSKNKFNNLDLLYGALFNAATGNTVAANELNREYNLRNGYIQEDRESNIVGEEASKAGASKDLFGIILGQSGNLEKISEDLNIPKEIFLSYFKQDPQLFLKIFAEKANLTNKMAEGGQFSVLDKEISVTIEDKTYNLLVARTEEEKRIGLQNVESMEDNEGMLFCYKDNPQHELSFWMKDTSIPLDIIFISDKDKVIEVKHGEPYSEELLTCKSKSLITGVIELNANSGVKKGMDIDFDNFNEEDYPELEPNKMYVIGSDGVPQAELLGEERIFSRIITRKLLKFAKKAYLSKNDKDYMKLGKIMFDELDAQEERDPQYVEARN